MRTFLPVALAVVCSVSLVACKKSEQHLDVSVDWNDNRQTIDGFGASTAFFGGNITDDQADQLFDAKKGIGLSLLRIMIGAPEDTQSDGSQPTDNPKTAPTAPELTTAQQAIARGTKIWAAAWTPPPIWKTTNNKKGSDPDAGYMTNKLQPEHYGDFANYLADFVDLMKQSNVSLVGVSPVNEPDYTASWDNAQMSPDELTKFMRENMGPTFASRFPNDNIKLIAPETANFVDCQKYIDPLLADSTAAGYVGIMATHPYSGNSGDNYHAPKDHGKSFWETEWSQENQNGDTPDPTMVSAIDMAEHMHEHMTVTEMNAWNWWAIYITEDGLNDDKRLNPAFIQPDATKGQPYMFKRGYAFGNWSKFVRPNFHRIGATDHPTAGVLIEAYRNDDHLAIIAVNTTKNTVTQRFKIVNGGSIGSVTPWVTSDSDSLASKSSLNVGSDGFTYDLPGMSVVTFVSWDANTDTPGLVLPTGADGGMDGGAAHNGLDCKNPVTPNNGGDGGVTDFTDWKGSTGNWGDPNGLHGSIYAYHGPMGSAMNATVDSGASPPTLHITGSVTMGDYGGAGLGFLDCATVANYSQVQFTLSGSSPGCDLELQLKTFDQTPTSQNPPGGCDQDAGSCYNYPVMKQVAVPSSDATTVTVKLSDFSGWSSDSSSGTAGQVVGLQWQFTGTNIPSSDSDAGDSTSDAAVGCPIDVAVTSIKFLP